MTEGFWDHFWRVDNSTVNNAAVLMVVAIMLAAPVILLAMACVIHHVFVLNKAVDGSITNLLLGLLGAVTGTVFGGAGTLITSMKTSINMVTNSWPAAVPAPGPGDPKSG